jgi:TPP-dependent pyruvate/acetoin dehydrogenase alpha subunit
LLDKHSVTAGEVESVKARVEGYLDAELEWAESQPMPAPEDALGGVYAEGETTTTIGAGKQG